MMYFLVLSVYLKKRHRSRKLWDFKTDRQTIYTMNKVEIDTCHRPTRNFDKSTKEDQNKVPYNPTPSVTVPL